MMETSRADEHDDNVMVQLMFGTLCPMEDKPPPQGRHCCHRPTARPKGQSLIVGNNRSKGRRGGSVAGGTTTDRARMTAMMEQGIHR